MKYSCGPRWNRKLVVVNIYPSLSHTLQPPSQPTTFGSSTPPFLVKGRNLVDLIPLLHPSLRMCCCWDGVLSPQLHWTP